MSGNRSRRPNSEIPLSIGAWKHVGESKENSEVLLSEHDEAKYVVSGEIKILDLASKTVHTAREGSPIWIERGSRSKILYMKDLVTIYAESRHGEKTIYPFQSSSTTPISTSDGGGSHSSFTSMDAGPSNRAVNERLTQLLQTYTKENTKSEAAYNVAKKILPGGNTRSVLAYSPFPLVLASGRDFHVTSLDGREYVDFVSEYSAGIYGHSHPTIQAAVQAALKTGFHLGGLTEHEAIFGSLIQQRFPSMERIRFCNSETEANQMAIGWPKFIRSEVLVFANGYHGGTICFHNKSEPMNIPHNFVIAPYNVIEGTKRLLTDKIAVILVEPVLGAGGCIPGNIDFLRFLRKAATEIGAILIFDEVMTSRLHVHGIQGHFDIKPDMTTLGKYLGGGFAFGAFGGKQDIMGRFNFHDLAGDQSQSLTHSGTFNNNIFAMTAGIAASALLTEDVFMRMNSLGDLLRDKINRIATDYGCESKLEATGFGSLVGLHFQGASKDVLLDSFFFHMLEHGLYVGKRGFFSVNMVHEEMHINLVLQAIEVFVQEFIS